MTCYDFYTTTGDWCDSCEDWQFAMLLPRLRALFGAVTWQLRGEARPVAGDDFATWLMSV